MNVWILVLIINSAYSAGMGNSVAIEHIEFRSKFTCETAANTLKETPPSKSFRYSIIGECFVK